MDFALTDAEYVVRRAVALFTGGLLGVHLSEFDSMPALKDLPKTLRKAADSIVAMSPELAGMA